MFLRLNRISSQTPMRCRNHSLMAAKKVDRLRDFFYCCSQPASRHPYCFAEPAPTRAYVSSPFAPPPAPSAPTVNWDSYRDVFMHCGEQFMSCPYGVILYLLQTVYASNKYNLYVVMQALLAIHKRTVVHTHCFEMRGQVVIKFGSLSRSVNAK